VVAIDGLDRAHVDRLADAGELPTLARLRSRGVLVDLLGGPVSDPRAYWAAMFGASEAGDSSGFIAAVRAADRASSLVHVPGTKPAPDGSTAVLPGADAATAFVGDSTGRIENLAALKRGNLRWPYASASREVARVVADVEVGEASRWLAAAEGTDKGRRGFFRLYRLDESAFYLTPIYRNTVSLPAEPQGTDESPSESEPTLFVADDPSVVAASSRTLEYLPSHLSDLSRDRADIATRLMEGMDWEIMVYFESMLAARRATELDASGETTSPTVSDLAASYAQVDSQLGRLLAMAGPQTLVLVLARSPSTIVSANRVRSPTGFLIAATDTGSALHAEAPIEQVAATLFNVAGLVAVDLADTTQIFPVAARFHAGRDGSRVGRTATVVPDVRRQRPPTAATLRELGLLTSSASIPASRDAETQPDG
jgi:hypothetical protein